MEQETVYFILSFGGAMLWYRVLFYIVPSYFKRPLTRSLLNLRWHHLHWGILFVLFGAVMLIVSGKNMMVVIALGMGLGLMMDLFIPSLRLETDREKELVVYGHSLIETGMLFLLVIFIVIAISLFLN